MYREIIPNFLSAHTHDDFSPNTDTFMDNNGSDSTFMWAIGEYLAKGNWDPHYMRGYLYDLGFCKRNKQKLINRNSKLLIDPTNLIITSCKQLRKDYYGTLVESINLFYDISFVLLARLHKYLVDTCPTDYKESNPGWFFSLCDYTTNFLVSGRANREFDEKGALEIYNILTTNYSSEKNKFNLIDILLKIKETHLYGEIRATLDHTLALTTFDLVASIVSESNNPYFEIIPYDSYNCMFGISDQFFLNQADFLDFCLSLYTLSKYSVKTISSHFEDLEKAKSCSVCGGFFLLDGEKCLC